MFLQDDDHSLQDIYKTIQLHPDLQPSVSNEKGSNHNNKGLIKNNFKPCVSFNTVPSYLGNNDGDDGLDFPGVQIPSEYTMEEYYDDESGYVSDNAEYFLRNNYVTNSALRGGSPPPRNFGGKGTPLTSMFRVSENGKIVRVDYPTTPTILNDAIVINRAQPGWNQLWRERKGKIEERIHDKESHFRYPDNVFTPHPVSKTKVMSDDGYTPLSKNDRRKEKVLHERVGFPNTPRTILCHLSGRRHTWVALDWTIRELAQDTDHIVVVANVPRFSGSVYERHRSRSRSRGPSVNPHPRSLSVDTKSSKNAQKHEEFIDWTSGYHKDVITNKLEDILTYIAVILPKNIAIKVTVEIVVGKTKKIMLDAMNVYTPEFCISTTLRWEKTDNLVLWKSRNLTDVLCTKYPVPVFVIPVKRMYEFEANLEREINSEESSSARSDSESPLSNQSGIADEELTPKDDEIEYKGQLPESPSLDLSSDDEKESDPSDTDDEATSIKSSKNDLISAAVKHRDEMAKALRKLDVKGHETRIEKQLDKLDLILDSSLRFSLEVESMAQDDTEAGFDKLKRVITGGTDVRSNSKRSMLDVADIPKKTSSKNISSEKPRAGQIKFASDVTSKDGKRALGNSKIKPQSRSSSPPLGQRTLSPVTRMRSANTPRRSHDLEPLRKMKTTQPANSIRKVRSTDNISRVKSNDSMASGGSTSSGKKKGGFLSIFKSSGSRSRSTSRRNSDGSDSDYLSSNSDGSKKRRSKLFGFS